MVNVSFLQELLNGIAERGRTMLPRALAGPDAAGEMLELARALVSGRGEASGVALARQILARYAVLDVKQRQGFFAFLSDNLGPYTEAVRSAASAFIADATPVAYRRLDGLGEPPPDIAPGADDQ